MKPYALSELELRHLIALKAVASAGSFWKAAEHLGCSQSALSQQIATAEAVVETKLIERSRGRRSSCLTEAGRLLLGHADAIVARLRAAHADITALAEGAAGTLRIGVFESVGARILPSVIREFHRKLPNVQVKLVEFAKDDQLMVLLERGELDLSFAVPPLPDGPFQTTALLEDPYVLVTPSAGLKELSEDPVPLEALRSIPLITPGMGRKFETLERFIESHGIALDIVFRSNQNSTIQALVAVNGWTALVPRLNLDDNCPDIHLSGPIRDLPPRWIVLAWHKDRFRSRASNTFEDTARQFCASLASRKSPKKSASGSGMRKSGRR